ncbi:hypothetical protein O181_033027 [Austropuccinia psidii MF-1]|uniref:Uncharacterized protein n=1 Tax=Austropuccinia psidii MF-1 TaxID=1389203 RepID=A0A9Q3D0L4_9BASI|nr:hypothetical protein [Austropuccinia psidii MF-1]
MGFKRQKQNPPNPPQQESHIPCMPHKQTPQQPTPGPSGTRWSEDLFCSKQPPFPFLILPFELSELTFPPFVEPSQHHEPPIPGPSKPSEPHEDALTCEPEPEVGLTKSMEEPFACPATPALVIIIDNMPVGSPLPLPVPPRTPLPPLLIPTMRLARNLPNYDQP